MKNYLSLLTHTQMFSGVKENEINAMLGCLNAIKKSYAKGEYVYHQGDIVSVISMVVEGQLYIQRDDYWGNSNIINAVNPGEMFGEAYVTPNSGSLLNNVIAAQNTTILCFDARRVLTTCSSACAFHTSVVRNLFYAISDKNRSLVQKLGYMTNRSTREKLLAYLSDEAKRAGEKTFTIPFNRQQLADYLSVERSAMSHELGKLRDEGLISFEKNKFTLH